MNFAHDENDIPYGGRIRLALSFSGTEATRIHINISAPNGMELEKNLCFFEKLRGKGTPLHFETDIFIRNDTIISKNIIELSASYDLMVDGSKQTGVAYTSVKIPVWLYSRMMPPHNEGTFKIVIDVNEKAPPIEVLYSDMIEYTRPTEDYYKNPNVASFLLNSGADCTLLFSKASNKVKLQSNTFDGLFLIFEDLCIRLRQTIGSHVRVEFSEQVPMKDFFDVLTERISIDKSIEENSENLGQKMEELTYIQKRLLTRYKEKNPSPMNNLDQQFDEVYHEIIVIAESVEKLQNYRKVNAQKVSLGVQLILQLVRMRFNLTEDAYTILKQYITPDLEGESDEFNWIDITDSNIFYLIKVVLLKNENAGTFSYKKVDNMQTFQQHFTLLIDKISKGALEGVKLDKEA